MSRRVLALALAGLAALAACASHQKSADRAAAVGDWRGAEREYAAALRDDPHSPELRAKHQAAREQALSDAVARARACAGAEDWECALAEADYAVGLAPADGELALFRRDAALRAGRLRVRKAGEAAARRDWAAGLALLAQARAATDDAGVAADARRAQPALVRGATEEAERHRAARRYPQALELLGLAAAVDGGVRPRLEAVRAEHEAFRDAEHERHVRAGDGLLAQGRLADAQAEYEAAQRHRPGGRAAGLARYAQHLREGEAAAAARDWPRAARAYESAARLGVDRDGFAAAQLERVRVRPYALRLRSVLLWPSRPDGRPWTGDRSRTYDAVLIGARLVGRDAVTRGEPDALRVATEVARGVPRENQPLVVATLELPAGVRASTAPRQGLWLPLDAAAVLATNGLDDRPVTIRIVQVDGPRQREVGAVTLPLGDLVTRRQVAASAESIARIELEALPSELAEGALSGAFADAGAAAGPAPTVRPAPRPSQR
jgi:hypothetical protein